MFLYMNQIKVYSTLEVSVSGTTGSSKVHRCVAEIKIKVELENVKQALVSSRLSARGLKRQTILFFFFSFFFLWSSLVTQLQQLNSMRDLHTGHWSSFGRLTRPAVLQMDGETEQNALRDFLEGESIEAEDDFWLISRHQRDKEAFFSSCGDEQGPKVNAILCLFRAIIKELVYLYQRWGTFFVSPVLD